MLKGRAKESYNENNGKVQFRCNSLSPHQKQAVVKIGKIQVDRNGGVLGSVTGFPSCVVPAGFTKPTLTAPIGVPVGLEI